MGSLQLIASFVIVDGIYILVDGLGRASDAGEPCDVVRDPCGRIVEMYFFAMVYPRWPV